MMGEGKTDAGGQLPSVSLSVEERGQLLGTFDILYDSP